MEGAHLFFTQDATTNPVQITIQIYKLNFCQGSIVGVRQVNVTGYFWFATCQSELCISYYCRTKRPIDRRKYVEQFLKGK